MVPLPKVRTNNSEYYANRPLVAVFIGATSGIGEHAVRALSKQYNSTKQSLRIYMIGRSQQCAAKIMSDCQNICPQAEFEFVQAHDLTLIREMNRICEEITLLEKQKSASTRPSEAPRIDLLVMTQGEVKLGPRQETSEGLDKSMTLLYYSRIRAITRLLPLLLASPRPHVVSVYAAGMEAKLIPDDLSLRKNYSFAQQRSHTAYFKTMAFERLARENPQLSLVHVMPGLVVGPRFYKNDLPLWAKLFLRLSLPLLRLLIAQPVEESGQRIISLGTAAYPASDDEKSEVTPPVSSDGMPGNGAYSVGQYGDSNTLKVEYVRLRKDGFEHTVWDHTMKAFTDIENGGRFND